jgi:hypothetical protein
MKLIRFASAVVLALILAGIAVSADTSQTYGPLAQSPQFQMRVTFIVAMEAPVILTEAATGTYTAPCHTLRANLAAAVARNPQSYAPIFAAHLVAHVNVTTAGALTGTLAAGTLDTPAADNALLAAVASPIWSTVAGCITNP